jgi:spermidine/putrescine transport system substrate-binding protein
MPMHVSRRRFGALVGSGLVAAASGLPRQARAAESITVLNWQGYGTDEPAALKAFTEKTGIAVKHDNFNSEEEMLTKLRTNPGAYDVVVINSARTQQASGEDLLAPLDFAKVANAKDLSPALRDHANFVQKGKVYGISWVWGMNSLALRRDKVKAESLGVLTDPAWPRRVALFDDAVTEIGIAALMTGQDINNPKDLKAIGAKLKEMKPGVKLLWTSESEWNKAFAAGEFDISIYWSGAAGRSQRVHNLPVDFVIPKEGAIGWLDGLSVPATSTRKDAAMAFINFMVDPAFYVPWGATGAPASANAAAMAALPAADFSKAIHKPEYLSKLQFMSPLPDDRRQAFLDLWQETKAFYAK